MNISMLFAPGGISRDSSGVANGLLSEGLRASTQGGDYAFSSALPLQSGGAVSMKEELVNIMRQVSERLNAIADGVSVASTNDISSQVHMLRCECAQLRQSVVSLSNSIGCLVDQLQGLNRGLGYGMGAQGYLIPSLLGLGSIGVVLGCIVAKRS